MKLFTLSLLAAFFCSFLLWPKSSASTFTYSSTGSSKADTTQLVFLNDFVPTPYSTDEVRQLIIYYSEFYGITPELPLRIAKCESGYRWNAKNSQSTASGPFQFLASTWKNTEEGRAGVSVFEAGANIRAAIRHIASKGPAPWQASINCWKGK